MNNYRLIYVCFSINRTILKREEVYRGPIEPGWGAGLLIPLREESENILLMTSLTLKSFLSDFPLTKFVNTRTAYSEGVKSASSALTFS